MAKYKIKASNDKGVVTSRIIEATSKSAVRSELMKEGLFPIDVSVVKGDFNFSFSFRKKKIKSSDFAVFNQGLMALVRAGLGVIKSLEALISKSKNLYLKQVISTVVEEVKTGKTLADAMDDSGDAFPPLYIATIKSGERTGDLVPALVGYISYQKRIEAIRKKVVSAFVYPVMLAGVSLLVVFFLVFYVIPILASAYSAADSQMPLISRVIMGGAYFLKRNFIYIAVICFAFYMLAKWYISTDKGRLVLDKFILTMPYSGDVVHEYATAKFSRTLSMVLKSGMPLVQALEMSKGVLSNSYLESNMDKVIKKSTEGTSVTESMAEFEVMPDISLEMFDIGEKSSSLDMTLDDIALYNEEQVDYNMGILVGFLEPAIIVIMGLVIMVIVVAMYLPIFMLGEVLT